MVQKNDPNQTKDDVFRQVFLLKILLITVLFATSPSLKPCFGVEGRAAEHPAVRGATAATSSGDARNEGPSSTNSFRLPGYKWMTRRGVIVSGFGPGFWQKFGLDDGGLERCFGKRKPVPRRLENVSWNSTLSFCPSFILPPQALHHSATKTQTNPPPSTSFSMTLCMAPLRLSLHFPICLHPSHAIFHLLDLRPHCKTKQQAL